MHHTAKTQLKYQYTLQYLKAYPFKGTGTTECFDKQASAYALFLHLCIQFFLLSAICSIISGFLDLRLYNHEVSWGRELKVMLSSRHLMCQLSLHTAITIWVAHLSCQTRVLILCCCLRMSQLTSTAAASTCSLWQDTLVSVSFKWWWHWYKG